MGDNEDIRGNAREDRIIESAILARLIELHPVRISFEELLREFEVERSDFVQLDAIERGVRELAAAGLAHREGEFVFPSRAAIRFEELQDG